MILTKTLTVEMHITASEVAELFAGNNCNTQALTLHLIALLFNEWGAGRDKQLMYITKSPSFTSEAKAWIKDLAEFIEATE